MVMGIYTIRDVDERTKRVIASYAHEHGLNIAEALRRLVRFATEHLHKKKKQKKYATFFEMYEDLKFKGPRDLSLKHDEAAYGV